MYGVESINKCAGLIPIVGIALALIVELALGLRGQYVFNPPFLFLALNLIFVVGVSLFAAYLSAKGYLLTGSLTLLFFALSFVLLVIMSTFNGLFGNFSPNWAVTEAAIALLLFSAFQACAGFQASFRSVPIGSEHRKARLTSSSLFVVFLSVLLTSLIWLDVFPPFFVNGVGVALIDQIVYAIAILFLSVSCALFLRLYLKSKSNVMYWYSLGLAIEAIGLYGATLQVQFSDIVVWTGRVGVYLAFIYFLIALLSSRKSKNAA